MALLGHNELTKCLIAGGDKLKEEPLVCEIYFNGTHPCAGGIMAVDGLTGKEIWRLYTSHEIFALNCNADMDKDGVLDCLGGGRAGVSSFDLFTPWPFRMKVYYHCVCLSMNFTLSVS